MSGHEEEWDEHGDAAPGDEHAGGSGWSAIQVYLLGLLLAVGLTVASFWIAGSHVVWGPGMTVRPHNHLMWAVIGVYTGRENNIFWRRLPRDADGKIEAAGAKSLGERDAEPLGRDIIHTVTNPIDRLTGAIHVYGGDFFATPRSEWDPETLVEGPFDVQTTMRMFEEANAAYEARLRAS